MEITIEISYYALQNDYHSPVTEFLNEVVGTPEITVSTGMMETVLTGEYDTLMQVLAQTIKPLLEKYPSVFVLKIANACQACKSKKI